MNLGDQLRKRRRAIFPPVTILQVAEKAALTKPTVTNIELGKTENPGINTVAAIENALGFFENTVASESV